VDIEEIKIKKQKNKSQTSITTTLEASPVSAAKQTKRYDLEDRTLPSSSNLNSEDCLVVLQT
jgi:hypothetical protein